MSNGRSRVGLLPDVFPRDQDYLLDWNSTSLALTYSTAVFESYPLLPLSATKAFDQAVIILGCQLSVTFECTEGAFNNNAVVAIGLASESGQVQFTGDSQLYVHTSFFPTQGLSAVVIQRNVGAVFSPPFLPFLQPRQGVSLYGTVQFPTGISWKASATIYFMRSTELRKVAR